MSLAIAKAILLCNKKYDTLSEVSIKSAVNDENIAQLSALAEELCGTAETAAEEAAAATKKYVCGICCYEYEGEKHIMAIGYNGRDGGITFSEITDTKISFDE
jgi:hypothetical protein